MKLKERAPFNLQFFAEGGEGDTGTSGTEENQGQGTEGAGQEQPKALDDLLNGDKTLQSEFDKRISKALETAKGKWQSEQKQAIEDAKTEAAKLAKMNVDEKAKYEADKQKDDFDKRLKDLTTRELKAEAYEQLAEKSLPKELVEILNYESADTVKASMEAVSTAFQQAVEKAVNEKLRGNGVPKGGAGAENALQDQIAKAMRGQI